MDPNEPVKVEENTHADKDLSQNHAHLVAAILLTAFSTAVGANAQNTTASLNNQRPRYKLIDLGTFGGPASYFSNGLDGILNEPGTAVGWANTSMPDPVDPFCFAPNCFVTHAFQVQDGAVTDLGTLPGGANSRPFGSAQTGLAWESRRMEELIH